MEKARQCISNGK